MDSSAVSGGLLSVALLLALVAVVFNGESEDAALETSLVEGLVRCGVIGFCVLSDCGLDEESLLWPFGSVFALLCWFLVVFVLVALLS